MADFSATPVVLSNRVRRVNACEKCVFNSAAGEPISANDQMILSIEQHSPMIVVRALTVSPAMGHKVTVYRKLSAYDRLKRFQKFDGCGLR